jgi:hypothetical protein
VFAPWKPFSPSAVSPSIRHPVITPAAASSALLQPPLEQPSGNFADSAELSRNTLC